MMPKNTSAIEMLFRQQEQLIAQTRNTLNFIGKLNGMSEQDVATCGKDQAMLDKLAADQKYAHETLKEVSTPTFFLNGERLQSAMSFEELELRIKPRLKK